MGEERKYALHRLRAGDYLLIANDGVTLWRIARYEDGPSHGIEGWPKDRMVWGCWRYDSPIIVGTPVDTEDWSRWEFWEGTLDKRAEAVAAALKSTPDGEK